MIVLSCEITPWLVVIFGLVTAGSLNITDQQTSESNQHDQVAILKQIRKVNDDGSYTFGYEAGDGSFKVETRDVLGNVKGTFGFVDANGEIKRVTYSSSNGTGFKATTISPLQERPSVIQNIPLKTNRSSIANIKKSNHMVFSTSTESSSSSTSPTSAKLSVIQSIPARNSVVKTAAIPSTTIKNTEKASRTIFGQYLRNSKNRSRQFMNEQQQKRLSILSEEEITTDRYGNGQQNLHVINPNDEIKTVTQKNNYLTKDSLDDILKPVDKFEDQSSRSEVSINNNNNYRRQIDEKTTIKVRESHEENNSNENLDVYNGRLLSTTRPLFTTTTTATPSTSKPKIIQRSNTESSKLNHTPKFKVLQSSEEDRGPAKFYNVKYENTKSFDTDRFIDEAPEVSGNFYTRDSLPMKPSVMSYNERAATTDYIVKDQMQPIYIRHQQPEKNQKDLPLRVIFTNIPSTTSIENEETNDEIPAGKRILFRVRAPTKQINYQSSEGKENIEYLTDINPTELPLASTSNVATTTNPTYIIRKKFNKFAVPHSEQDTPSQINFKLIQQLHQHLQQQQLQYQQQQEHQSMREKDYLRDYFYRNIVLPPEPPNPIALPLSRRDFQILLRRLLTSQYGVQAFDHPRTYLNHALDDEHLNPYHASSSRYSLVYENHPTEAIPVVIPYRYNQRMTVSEPDIPRMTTTVNSPLDVAFSPNLHQDSKYVKRVNRNRYYNNENINSEPVISFNDDAILPPPVREALLLRMLQLAIDNKQQSILNYIPISTSGTDSNTPTSIMSKVTAVPTYRKTGPTRSVQIIADDKSDEYNGMKNKP